MTAVLYGIVYVCVIICVLLFIALLVAMIVHARDLIRLRHLVRRFRPDFFGRGYSPLYPLGAGHSLFRYIWSGEDGQLPGMLAAKRSVRRSFVFFIALLLALVALFYLAVAILLHVSKTWAGWG